MRYNKYTPMSAADWGAVAPEFDRQEKWGDPDKIDARLVCTLSDIRRYTGRRIFIHCGWELRGSGWHPKHRAVDFHLEGLHPVDQFLICSRYDQFNGLGIYFWWNRPGIHADTRPSHLTHLPEARWVSISQGEYLPLTWENLLKAA